MILWKIFKALCNYCAGVDSDMEYVYNLFNNEQHKEECNMGFSEEMLAVCRKHPEAQEIFKLAQLMSDAGYNFWFNVQDDCRSGENIFDDEYEYVIEIQTGTLIGSRAPITVFFNRNGEGGGSLEVLDMRPAVTKVNPSDEDGDIHSGLSAEQAMEIIEKFFKGDK